MNIAYYSNFANYTPTEKISRIHVYILKGAYNVCHILI
jgi:hypothetical protein